MGWVEEGGWEGEEREKTKNKKLLVVWFAGLVLFYSIEVILFCLIFFSSVGVEISSLTPSSNEENRKEQHLFHLSPAPPFLPSSSTTIKTRKKKKMGEPVEMRK